MKKGTYALLLMVFSISAIFSAVLWPQKRMQPLEAAVIKRGDLITTVLAEGVVSYVQEQPCISLRSGRVCKVCVKQGDFVRQGDLILTLDTSAEERALADLYQMKYAYQDALSRWNDSAQLLGLQMEQEMQAAEIQLQSQIAAGQLRAAGDGVVGNIYVQEGDLVYESMPVALIHGSEKQIALGIPAETSLKIAPDAAVFLHHRNQKQEARIVKTSLPDTAGMQTVYADVEDIHFLDTMPIGSSLEAEIETGCYSGRALIPLAAIDSGENIWVVDRGVISCQPVQFDGIGRTYAASGLEWEGKTVILYPEQSALQEGMRVQVVK